MEANKPRNKPEVLIFNLSWGLCGLNFSLKHEGNEGKFISLYNNNHDNNRNNDFIGVKMKFFVKLDE